MVALLIYGAVWKAKGQRREAPISETYGERAVIFRMISDLTDTYESGDISDEEYRQRLMVLNARLTALGSHGQG